MLYNQTPEIRARLIVNACVDCVTNYLKHNTDIQFPTIVIQEKDNYGRICLYVKTDAKNSSGELSRNKFHVILQSVNDDGTYEVSNNAVCEINSTTKEDFKNINHWDETK